MSCAVHRAGHGRLRAQRHAHGAARLLRVDRHQIVLAALSALAKEGTVPRETVAEAIARYGIAPDAPAPWTV